jgi:hypothetical protein
MLDAVSLLGQTAVPPGLNVIAPTLPVLRPRDAYRGHEHLLSHSVAGGLIITPDTVFRKM